MAFDFNDTKPQKMYGPVPAGSVVKLRVDLVPATNPHEKDNRIHVSTRSGMLMLSMKFTVVAGTYEDVSWKEFWSIPAGQQPKNVEMTDGRIKGCNINASKMRAIVEAAKGVNPNDMSESARNARKLKSLMDIDGMEFPAKLKLSKGREVTDDMGNVKVYVNNEVSFIITPDNRKYKDIMAGGEDINPNGATSAEPTRNMYAEAEPVFAGGQFPTKPSEMEDAPF